MLMPSCLRTLVLFAAAACVAACTAPTELGLRDRAMIQGRTFVVTGASSGIGRGAALKLASYGGNVVLAARRADALEDLARQARAYGAQALVVPTDVSQPDAVQHLADAAVARFGRIDAWVNDAAVAAIGRFDKIPLRDHARVVDVNLNGYIYGSYVALQQFHRQGWGTLVNVASVEAYGGSIRRCMKSCGSPAIHASRCRPYCPGRSTRHFMITPPITAAARYASPSSRVPGARWTRSCG